MPEASRPRPAWLPPRDGSRDPRAEDPTNIWFVHLIGRMLLPLMLRLRIPANAISVAGLAFGTGAALAFLNARDPAWASLGFALGIAWLIADGLDGMVARATGTASALGRVLDGVCDHAVFLLVYLALGWSVGSWDGWVLGTVAGLVHAVQASLYEGERIRYHRRIRGDPGAAEPAPAHNALVRLYDKVAHGLDRLAAPFDRALAASPDRAGLAAAYRERAAAPLRLMIPLTNNMRLVAIYLACLIADARLFWWYQLIPLTALTVAGLAWARRIEARLTA